MVSLLVIENQLDQIPSSWGLCLLDKPLVALQEFCFVATVSVHRFYDLVGENAGTRGAQSLEGLFKPGHHKNSVGGDA